MKQFSFKVFEEEDPDIIQYLNSLTCRRRSEEIRKALRAYMRKSAPMIRIRKGV